MGEALLRLCRLLSIVSNNSSAIRPKRTNGSTMKPYACVWASASVPCNHTEIWVKIPHSMIEHNCYYKERDITDLLSAKSEWTMVRTKSLHRKPLRCSCFHNWWKEYWRNWSGIALPPVRCWSERFTSRARKFAVCYVWVPVHFKTIGTAERLPIAKSEARYSTGKATYKPCSKGTITQYARRKANKTCRKKS